jgi:transketolase
MRAAWILKRDYGYQTRILNMHTLKPIDRKAVLRAARETGVLVTAEEHQAGALGWRVAGLILEDPVLQHPVLAGYIGVQDRFGDSGAPWELVKEFEVSAEHIARKAAELLRCASRPPGRR